MDFGYWVTDPGSAGLISIRMQGITGDTKQTTCTEYIDIFGLVLRLSDSVDGVCMYMNTVRVTQV